MERTCHAEKAVEYRGLDVWVCLMCSSNSMESSMHKVKRWRQEELGHEGGQIVYKVLQVIVRISVRTLSDTGNCCRVLNPATMTRRTFCELCFFPHVACFLSTTHPPKSICYSDEQRSPYLRKEGRKERRKERWKEGPREGKKEEKM